MTGGSPVERRYRRLFEVLAEPRRLLDLKELEWDDLLPVARSARLFSRVAALTQSHGLMPRIPPKVAGHMAASLRFAAHRQQKMLWELHHLESALHGVAVPILILKGAGYLTADLVAAKGRVFSDVDLLVPRTELGEVEAALRAAGWRSEALHPYDDQYYRKWMHEIPPLWHPDRGVEVDIHHTLSPLTSRIQVDADPLFAAAMPVPACRFQVPAPADMVLHSAIHLFYGGEFEYALRDLSDLDVLMREFAARDSGFWQELLLRAESLRLTRPLFYALRYTHRILGTPIPPEVLTEVTDPGLGRAALKAMDSLVTAAFIPSAPGAPGLRTSGARSLLWMRSHWLRMPPGLLLRHLLCKLGGRRKPPA
jgi:hypothetical protein